MTKLQPLGDRVLIRPIEADEKIGNVYIPENAREKSTRGEVLAVGDGGRTTTGVRIEPTIQQGDTVVYAKWGGTEIRDNGEDLVLLREADVLAIEQD